MPTVTVSGSGDDQRALQSIADSVARSKKVIFVTGAGISTNSGIPVSHILFHLFVLANLFKRVVRSLGKKGGYEEVVAIRRW